MTRGASGEQRPPGEREAAPFTVGVRPGLGGGGRGCVLSAAAASTPVSGEEAVFGLYRVPVAVAQKAGTVGTPRNPTCISARTHTCSLTFTHVHVQAHMCVHICTSAVHPHTHAHKRAVHAHMCTHAHTGAHVHMHAHMHMDTHTHSHRCAHVRTHAEGTARRCTWREKHDTCEVSSSAAATAAVTGDMPITLGYPPPNPGGLL